MDEESSYEPAFHSETISGIIAGSEGNAISEGEPVVHFAAGVSRHVGKRWEIAIEYTRRRADDSVFSRCNSWWIATVQDGPWGLQLRSSGRPLDLVQTIVGDAS